jgi:hypothetical protein
MRTRKIVSSAAGLLLAGWMVPAAHGAGVCVPSSQPCAAAAGAAAALPEDDSSVGGFGGYSVAPVMSNPHGQTYGRWAVEFWQWVFGIPAAKNPLLDATGAHCAERQVGNVWFLAGSALPGSIRRACTVPEGKALFFPLINIAYLSVLNDPPETRTPGYVRAAGRCTEPVSIKVWIDGQRLPNPYRYFTGPTGSLSPLFNVQMPADNIFGADTTVIPELFLGPSAEQGYYLFLRPLSPGDHVIKWLAAGCTKGNVQDITYKLRIAPR